MKIALLQCNSVTGDVVGNEERILAFVRAARCADADLCITPELALSGVAPGRFLRTADFGEGLLSALERLAEHLMNGPALLLGCPVPSQYGRWRFSNAAVLISEGRWQVISRKVAHRDGDVGAGDFEPGVSCGIMQYSGWRFGVVLSGETPSEEGSFWNIQDFGEHSPLSDLLRRGVDAIVYMAGAPWHIGAQSACERALSGIAARHHVHVFAVNLVGGNDSCVYNGQSMAVDSTGRLYGRARAFDEEMLLVETTGSQSSVALRGDSDEENLWNALVLGTRDFVRQCGVNRVLVGLSGGMDSALVCCIAKEALGAESVIAVMMPSPYSSEGSLTDARSLAENLGLPTPITIPIEALMRSFFTSLAPGMGLFPPYEAETTFENLQARIRAVILSTLANRAQAMILNTSNKSEGAMGYSTLYGDTVGALAVIGDVTKSQVYALARWYNAHHGREILPQAIFDKQPSAELRPGQKDSDSLPPYDILDPLLEKLLADGSREENLCNASRDIQSRLFKAEFKRRQEPLPLIVSKTPFGEVWRVPVAGRYRPV